MPARQLTALQLCIAAKGAGESPLVIATEQSAELIRKRIRQLANSLGKRMVQLADQIPIIDDVSDLRVLPAYVTRHVLAQGGEAQGYIIYSSG